MDKKSSKSHHSQQSANKSATAESKKNQDVVNGKTFPKTPRRRESPGANGFSKNEQSRRSNHQKTRNFDKRPKPKGQYYGGAKEDTKVVDENAAEYGSVMAPGSKKQNLNHLLNFHYEPRDGIHGGRNNYGRSNYNNNNRWLPSVQRHKYNKELFLQANCQFVVRSDGDYSIHLIDPDTLVDWKLIEQIKIYTSESLSCPICLCPPIAGKMTRCGHVYCWPCILHYLSLSDKNWRKCPICYESIHKSDLKSVTEITQQQLNIGDTVNLRLMRRKRGSLLAVPVEDFHTPDPDDFFTISDQKDHSNQIYSKLLRAEVRHVVEIIDNEKNQLKFEQMMDPHSPENCFIEQALSELSDWEERILKGVVKGGGNITGKKSDNNVVEGQNGGALADICEEKNTGERKNDGGVTGVTTPGQQNLPKFFYFYQAEDGQHIYLHAMNVKMLEVQYGDLEHSPRTLTGKILEKEGGSFTEDLRKRMRYLCHLPLTCSFEIAEIELTTPLVSADVLDYFKEQLDARERRRRRRERDEKKREKKITAEENKKLGRYPTAKVHIESHRHFPGWPTELPSSSATISTPPESIASSSVASSPSHSTLGDSPGIFTDSMCSLPSQNDQGPSFAQMLRNENSNMSDSKVWPSMTPSLPLRKSSNVIAPQNEDDYAQAPSHSQSFGDVLALALEASTIQEDPIPRGKAKKNKKRGKATLLYASGMARSS
ncbi:E3 ubiquitin-protein ligase RNF10 [Diachasmimorpha longicaudata]|uniref:E3 ubiquitin-protein ligase RNF10 n=1 Tax=Diachasmimorpha longicaudata TaxID=58733 RepID=UPI0030B8D9B3